MINVYSEDKTSLIHDIYCQGVHDLILQLYPYFKDLLLYFKEKFLSHTPLFMLPEDVLAVVILNCETDFILDVVYPWVCQWRRSLLVAGSYSRAPWLTHSPNDFTGANKHLLSLPMCTEELMHYENMYNAIVDAPAIGREILAHNGFVGMDTYGRRERG